MAHNIGCPKKNKLEPFSTTYRLLRDVRFFAMASRRYILPVTKFSAWLINVYLSKQNKEKHNTFDAINSWCFGVFKRNFDIRKLK